MIGYTVTIYLDFLVLPNSYPKYYSHVAQRRWNFLWSNNIPPSENARVVYGRAFAQNKKIEYVVTAWRVKEQGECYQC